MAAWTLGGHPSLVTRSRWLCPTMSMSITSTCGARHKVYFVLWLALSRLALVVRHTGIGCHPMRFVLVVVLCSILVAFEVVMMVLLSMSYETGALINPSCLSCSVGLVLLFEGVRGRVKRLVSSLARL